MLLFLRRAVHFTQSGQAFPMCYGAPMNRILGAAAAATALIIAASASAGEIAGQEAEIKMTIELEPTHVDRSCQAQLDMSYYQKGPSVVVESELTNDNCGASSGTYVIEVRYRSDSPEILKKEFPETWERPDDQPVRAEKEYFVAENVDVVRVRSRKLRCECAVEEAPADEPPATE